MPPKRVLLKGATPSDCFYPQSLSCYSNIQMLFQEERPSGFARGEYGFMDWRTGLSRGFQPNFPHVWHDASAPRQRSVTAEEAAKNAQELIEEEERVKEKAARNKSKKMRKNEKKRLAKENASASLQPKEDDTHSVRSDTSAESSLSRGCHDDEESKENQEASDVVRTKPRKKLKNKLQQEETELDKDKTKSHKSTTSVEDLHKLEDSLEAKAEKSVGAAADLRVKQSTQLAASGNHLATTGQYEMAVKCFTDAIKLNPLEFKLFGNRSLCLERMQQYEAALMDADIALSMEPQWVKGLFRKGKALCGLKRYYDATLVFQEILNLDSSSADARKELERAQTLHLMEMGFSQEECSVALRSQPTLEEALQSLFDRNVPEDTVDQSVEGEDGWIVLQSHRSRPRQPREPGDQKDHKDQRESSANAPRVKNVSPKPKNIVKLQLPSVFVSSIAPSVTYAALHQLFSRVGSVYSIKMLLDSRSAFIFYKLTEESDNALGLDGAMLEGSPVSVQPCDKRTRIGADFNPSTAGYKRECFFWRTVGCTRDVCTFRHVPENKGIDKDKFDGRLGLAHT